ncbi:hypothetical protein HDU98_011068 [Podochytrium sp. JEL0797]|nr:hypothetical protein HDU98_011068 [Podochytrium sp. JEL0797]
MDPLPAESPHSPGRVARMALGFGGVARPAVPVPKRATPTAPVTHRQQRDSQGNIKDLIKAFDPDPPKDFSRRRVMPVVAFVMALHIVSPRLSASLWGVIFKIMLRKNLVGAPTKQPEGAGWLNGMLMPIVVIAIAGFMLSPSITSSSADRTPRLSDAASSDVGLNGSTNSTLRNLSPESRSRATTTTSSLLESVNEILAERARSESTTRTLSPPRQNAKRLPTPPVRTFTPQPVFPEESAKQVTETFLAHVAATHFVVPVPLPALPTTAEPEPSAESPIDGNGELTPTMEFENLLSGQSFLSTFDQDTLNAILYAPTHHPDLANSTMADHAPSPLISDTDLARLFPLPAVSRTNHLQLSPPPARLPKSRSDKNAVKSSKLFSTPNSYSLSYICMNLSTLPTSIPTHTHLQRLHLAGNALTELPAAAMAQLPALRFLDVSDNRIARLTLGVGVCKGLRELYARNCGMMEVEEGVLEGWRGLEVLDLSSNKLTGFSNFAFTHNTSRLHTLILSNNRLQQLPASLGLHRGRELVFLLIGGNAFDPALRVFTDPIVTASAAIIPRVTKEISKKLAVVSDASLRSGGGAVSPVSSVDWGEKGERESLYEWDDEDVRSIHDAEFDSNLNDYSYKKPNTEYNRLRRRSSLPDANRSESRRAAAAAQTAVSPSSRRSGDYNHHLNNNPSWDPMESSTATSYHASTNPSYVYIQRLLSHLRDVYDLTPSFHRSHVIPLRASSRPTSKQDVRVSSPPVDEDQNDDPDAPHLSPDERERIRKRQSPTRRAHIAAEVLSTERTYVNELKTLVSLYADPLERGILGSADMAALFANLKSVFHLLPNLERALQSPDQPLGSIFNEAAPFFKMYSAYYNNFDTANEMVMHLEQLAASGTGQLQSPLKSTALSMTSLSSAHSTLSSRRTLAKKFKNLVKIAKTSPSHTQISLQSYLILPVQRLPRYKLLVDQLLESTPIHHPDRADLKSAAAAIRACVAECNDKKRETEHLERGMKQMARIRVVKSKSVGSAALTAASAGRVFVKEDVARVVKCVERAALGGPSSEGTNTDWQFAMIQPRDRVFKTQVVSGVVEARFAMGLGVAATVPPPVAVLGQPNLGAGLDALSVYGVQRSVGGEARFLVFADVLCWCKPISVGSSPLGGGGGSVGEAEFDLVRALELGPGTKIETMVVLNHEGQQQQMQASGGGGGTRFADRSNSSVSIEHLRGYAAKPASSDSQHRLSGLSQLTLTNSRGSTISSSASSTPVVREMECVLRISDRDSVLYLRGGQTQMEAWVEMLKGLGCDDGGE